MIVDTSALLAYFDHDEPRHDDVRPVIDNADSLVVSPYVVAELEHLVATKVGADAELAVLRELSGGAWDLDSFGTEDLAMAVKVVTRYADQRIGVADASIVVLADRHGTRTIATLDRRHFDVLRPLSGGRFAIVP